MNQSNSNISYFIFSLDTELAWGHYDKFKSELYSSNGKMERQSIERLLSILDTYNIVATWAVVGHLFFENCENCNNCPILNWKGVYSSFEEIYGTNNPLWYGNDVINLLISRGSRHEIAFHGYTHRVFDEKKMTKNEANNEIQEWIRLGARRNIQPRTVVFPRNKVGHLSEFKKAGFNCYRSDELLPSIYYTKPIIGKVLNRMDLVFQTRIPEVYNPTLDQSGLVNLPSSRGFFRMNRKVERFLDAINLHNLRIKRMIKGVEKAVNENKILHIYAHPCDFKTEKDFYKLEYLFAHISKYIENNQMQSIGMAELAEKFMNNAI
ncbi:MAG: polysaccharide deacetylase family protein [Anaerolineaceae bacterium]|nr:polysaccharide deacetylase family protein [Anaerolineaceae bacterium]